MTARRNFPGKVKDAAYERAAGRCENCTAPLRTGKFHYDHVIADALGGEPTLENCAVLCVACHGAKTPGDTTLAAKIKRVRRKHNGDRRQPSRPLDGTRASGWRKPFNGPPERRT